MKRTPASMRKARRQWLRQYPPVHCHEYRGVFMVTVCGVSLANHTLPVFLFAVVATEWVHELQRTTRPCSRCLRILNKAHSSPPG
jgi:hypothetical protein